MALYPKSKNKMIQVSGQDGPAVKSLHGGERIYSRADTKQIVSMAKSAKSPKDFEALGKFVINATRKQDLVEKEYV